MGDLESAFKFLAEDSSDIIPLSKLKEAFREITPVHFLDSEVDAMLRRVVTTASHVNGSEEHVSLHELCKVVCQTNFQQRHGHRGGTRSSTKNVICSFQLFKDEDLQPALLARSSTAFQTETSRLELDKQLSRFHSLIRARAIQS